MKTFKEFLNESSYAAERSASFNEVGSSKEAYQILNKMAERNNAELVTFDAGTTEIEDLRPLDTAEGDALPEWARQIIDNPDTEFILGIVNVDKASKEVLNALLPIILEGDIMGEKCDNVQVRLFGTHAAAMKMPSILKSRLGIR